jgi:transcriptional regulator with XRE-family HTH domain
VDRESVGSRVKALRKQQGLTGKELAARAGFSAAAVSKFENGLLRPTDHFIEAVIQALKLSSADAYALRELAAFVNSQFARWSLSQAQVKTNQINVGIRERNARTIRTFWNQLIPGLLQSEKYMRAIFETFVRPEQDDLSDLVKSRLKRQRILGNKRNALTFVLGEGALRTCFGKPAVLRDQLQHLAKTIDRYPSVEIRVLPWHKTVARLILESFVIYDERTVNIEVLKGELDLWTKEDVAFYVDTMNYLVSASLPPASSKDFIRDIMHDLEKRGGD